MKKKPKKLVVNKATRRLARALKEVSDSIYLGKKLTSIEDFLIRLTHNENSIKK